uniref:Uncharacterized protein n=1 Tax=Vitis vinifera TaxID=29760 RepID=F6HN94_VITVI
MKAARETRALKEAKDKLQKRVEEFTWRLQLEKRLRDSSLALSSPREPQSEEKPQKSLIEKQQENQDLLINVFDRIIQTIGAAIEGLRASPQSAGFSFLNGRVLGGLDDLRQVEAKYAAFLFKQQLTTFLENRYGMIRDNLKKYFPIAWIVYSGNSS